MQKKFCLYSLSYTKNLYKESNYGNFEEDFSAFVQVHR